VSDPSCSLPHRFFPRIPVLNGDRLGCIQGTPSPSSRGTFVKGTFRPVNSHRDHLRRLRRLPRSTETGNNRRCDERLGAIGPQRAFRRRLAWFKFLISSFSNTSTNICTLTMLSARDAEQRLRSTWGGCRQPIRACRVSFRWGRGMPWYGAAPVSSRLSQRIE
jgi:hypothetical protein